MGTIYGVLVGLLVFLVLRNRSADYTMMIILLPILLSALGDSFRISVAEIIVVLFSAAALFLAKTTVPANKQVLIGAGVVILILDIFLSFKLAKQVKENIQPE